MFPTRENSGLVVEVDAKGRQHLFVNGTEVMGILKFEHVTGGDVDRALGGVIIVSITARLVTFRSQESKAADG